MHEVLDEIVRALAVVSEPVRGSIYRTCPCSVCQKDMSHERWGGRSEGGASIEVPERKG